MAGGVVGVRVGVAVGVLVAVAVGIAVTVGRGRGRSLGAAQPGPEGPWRAWPGPHPGGSQGVSVRVRRPLSTRTRSAAGTTGPARRTRA